MCAPSFLQQAGKSEGKEAVASAEKAGTPPSRTIKRIAAKRRIAIMRLQEPLEVGNGHEDRPPTRVGRESGFPNRSRTHRRPALGGLDMSQRKKYEACSYDLRGAKGQHVREPDSRDGRFTLLAPGVGASTRNQWTG